jgi:hypothetical protein
VQGPPPTLLGLAGLRRLTLGLTHPAALLTLHLSLRLSLRRGVHPRRLLRGLSHHSRGCQIGYMIAARESNWVWV